MRKLIFSVGTLTCFILSCKKEKTIPFTANEEQNISVINGNSTSNIYTEFSPSDSIFLHQEEFQILNGLVTSEAKMILANGDEH